MSKIIINATAARSSGALTILKDFISYLELNSQSNEYEYHLITTVPNFKACKKVIVHVVEPMSWWRRIKWDSGGLQKWCLKQPLPLVPCLIISMQNTCTKWSGDNIPTQLVYYHQPLPLIPYKWKFYNKDEYKLWLYAKFYRYFVNRNNKYAKYVVQLQYIKKLFIKKFRNIDENDVFVLRPNHPLIDISEFNEEPHPFRLIYPATPLSYKNHKVIIQAVELIKKDSPDILKNTEIVFTISDDNEIKNWINKTNVEQYIKCIGSIPYKDLLNLYKNSDVLLFPSKIESYGLPLVEAMIFGLYIVASNLPYANEVLENYGNVCYVNPNSIEDWQKAIIDAIKLHRQKYDAVNVNYISAPNTWNDFMGIALSLL